MQVIAEITAINSDGARDLTHIDRAFRAYRSAKLQMAANGRAVVLFDLASEAKFVVESAADLRILLFAAAAAYRGARSEGCTDAADRILAAVRAGDSDERMRVTSSLVPLPWA